MPVSHRLNNWCEWISFSADMRNKLKKNEDEEMKPAVFSSLTQVNFLQFN